MLTVTHGHDDVIRDGLQLVIRRDSEQIGVHGGTDDALELQTVGVALWGRDGDMNAMDTSLDGHRQRHVLKYTQKTIKTCFQGYTDNWWFGLNVLDQTATL